MRNLLIATFALVILAPSLWRLSQVDRDVAVAQTNPAAPANAAARREMKELLKQKAPDRPAPKVPTFLHTTKQNPAGGKSPERVLVVRRRTPATRVPRFIAIAQNVANFDPTTSDEDAARIKLIPPIPDVTIYSGWLYVNGDKPCVGTTAVIAQAEGCELLLVYRPETNPRYHRVYYLEGDPDKYVWLYRVQQNGVLASANNDRLTVGTYTDVEVNDDGNFVRFRGQPNASDPPILHTIDESDPEFQKLIADVDAARDENEVS